MMTSGVAPRASIADPLRMSTDPTTLSEFVDDAGDPAESERDDAPTPAENAHQIEYLVDVVETLNEQMSTLIEEFEQHDAPDSIDTKQPDDERMFQ